MSEHARRLVDEAVRLANEGDLEGARGLAAEVLRHDATNQDARELVDAGEVPAGEIRRLVIVFADVVGSTELSAGLDPDDYTERISRYQRLVRRVLDRHGAGVVRVIGDGTLAVFGHPDPHEDDAGRAIRAAIELTEQVRDADHSGLDVIHTRAAVHFGLVRVNLVDGDVFGLAPNLAARLQGVAQPDQVVISEDVLPLIGDAFEIERAAPEQVKGIAEPIVYYRVLGSKPVDSRRGRVWEAPFVGRQAETNAIEQWLHSGESSMLVWGEPGVGKSRLVDQVLQAEGDSFGRVLAANCAEDDEAEGFSSIRGLLQLDRPPTRPSAQALLANLERDVAALGLDREQHLGPLALALGLSAEAGFERPETDITKLHERIVASLDAWFACLCAHGPVLLLVEDLQWSDGSSRAVLARLASQAIPQMKLLMTAREDDLPEDVAVRLAVSPLTEEAALELTAAVGSDLPPDRRRDVVARGVGIPLFIEELARWDGTPPAGGEMPVSSHDSVVPDVLYGPLVTRLYAEDVDVNLARLAATIGEEFDTDVLATASHRAPDAFATGLSSLLEAGIVHDLGGGERYAFRHALVRDVAYEVQPLEVRRSTHASVARALQDQRDRGAAVPAATIAGHFQRGGRLQDAIGAYETAAQESMQRGQLEEGRSQLDTALDLLARLATESEVSSEEIQHREVGLRLLRGFIAVSAGGNADPRAGEDYEVCTALAPALTSTDDYIGMLGALWGYYSAKGDLGMATELIDTILDTPGVDDPAMRADNLTAKGMTEFFRGEFASADDYLGRVRRQTPEGVQEERALSRWQFPNDPVGTGQLMYALTRWELGDPEGFRRGCEDARRRVGSLSFPHGPFTLAFCLCHEAWVFTEMGDHERAGQVADHLVSLSGEHGFDYWLLTGLAASGINTARRELAAAEPDTEVLATSIDSVAESVAVQQMVGAEELLPYFVSALGDVLAAAGDADGGMARLDEAVEIADRTGSRYYLAETHRVRARLMRDRDPTASLQEVWRARELAHRQGSVPYEYRALLDLAALGEDVGELLRRLPEPAARAAGLAPPGPPGR